MHFKYNNICSVYQGFEICLIVSEYYIHGNMKYCFKMGQSVDLKGFYLLYFFLFLKVYYAAV